MNRAKASAIQLTYLAEHMHNHPELARGYIGNSLQARASLEKEWMNLANTLNSLGGPIKTMVKWKQTWRDLKNSEKRKASYNRKEFQGNSTVNGPSTLHNMIPVENEAVTVPDPLTIHPLDVCVIKTETRKDCNFAIPIIEMGIPGPSEESLPVLDKEKIKPVPKLRQFKRGLGFCSCKKILSIEKQKLKYKKEKIKVLEKRNKILETKNEILENKNAAINRLADILSKISYKLIK